MRSTSAPAQARLRSHSRRSSGRSSASTSFPSCWSGRREGAPANVTFVEGDATHLPFETRSFDLSCSRRTLHHIAPPELAHRELARVTAPGGRVLVDDQIAPADPLAAFELDRFERARDPSHTRYACHEQRRHHPQRRLRPDQYVARIVPAGASRVDQFVLAIFAWALLGFGNVYFGLAQRALDLTLESIKAKKSVALSRSMAYHAHVQYQIAEMVMDLESIGAQLDKTAADWSNGVDYGANWVIKIVGTKYKAVEGAWRVVDTALDLAGGFGVFKQNEIERLFRDARLGRIHPANAALSHEFVAKTALGINPDEQPRWG